MTQGSRQLETDGEALFVRMEAVEAEDQAYAEAFAVQPRLCKHEFVVGSCGVMEDAEQG